MWVKRNERLENTRCHADSKKSAAYHISRWVDCVCCIVTPAKTEKICRYFSTVWNALATHGHVDLSFARYNWTGFGQTWLFWLTHKKSFCVQWMISFLNISSKLGLFSMKIRVRPLCVPMWSCCRTKYKILCCDCYDFMTVSTTPTTTSPLKFIISMLHRIFEAAVPFGGWLECAENLKWKFIVLLTMSARRFVRFCVQWACSVEWAPCTLADTKFSHGAHKSHFNCFVKIRWMENMNT